MVEVLRPHLSQSRRGGQNKLSVEDQLLVALEYWREYRSQFQLRLVENCTKPASVASSKKVEDVLVKCGKFRLPSQRLYTNRVGWSLVVDVGEMQIERPKKARNATESGKQKCHTMKSQLLVNWETEIICTAVQGRTHDFKLLKRSRLPFVVSQLC